MRLAEQEAELKAKEVLAAELEVIRKKQLELEKLQTQAKLKAERMKVEELKKSFQQIDEASRVSGHQSGHQLDPRKRLIVPSAQSSQTSDETSVELLTKIALQLNLPRSEPEVFDGTDCTKLTLFRQTFHHLVANKALSPAEQLYYLQRYTKDDPRELVQSCLHLESTEDIQKLGACWIGQGIWK